MRGKVKLSATAEFSKEFSKHQYSPTDVSHLHKNG
jgi:hypothetical protein